MLEGCVVGQLYLSPPPLPLHPLPKHLAPPPCLALLLHASEIRALQHADNFTAYTSFWKADIKRTDPLVYHAANSSIEEPNYTVYKSHSC